LQSQFLKLFDRLALHSFFCLFEVDHFVGCTRSSNT
jgi:hypothetical protein